MSYERHPVSCRVQRLARASCRIDAIGFHDQHSPTPWRMDAIEFNDVHSTHDAVVACA